MIGKQQINILESNDYVYKANSKIQSWSTDYTTASTFGNHDMLNEVSKSLDFNELNSSENRYDLLMDLINDDLRIAFVLEYVTNPNEFIFKSKYFRMLSMVNHEDELIRIDNKPINVIAKFNNNENFFISQKSINLLYKINLAITEL